MPVPVKKVAFEFQNNIQNEVLNTGQLYTYRIKYPKDSMDIKDEVFLEVDGEEKFRPEKKCYLKPITNHLTTHYPDFKYRTGTQDRAVAIIKFIEENKNIPGITKLPF